MGRSLNAGKQCSRCNSTKHGVLSRVVPAFRGFDGERELFQGMLAGLKEDLNPSTQLETTLVELMGADLFRLRTLQEMETAVLTSTATRALAPQGPSVEELDAEWKIVSSLFTAVNQAQPQFAMNESEAKSAATLLAHEAELERLGGEAGELTKLFGDSDAVTELLTGRQPFPDQARLPWGCALGLLEDNLADACGDRARQDAVYDERVQKRASEQLAKLPSLESLAKYDSHKRRSLQHSLRTLLDFRALAKLIRKEEQEEEARSLGDDDPLAHP